MKLPFAGGFRSLQPRLAAALAGAAAIECDEYDSRARKAQPVLRR
jgi:hypothetical protein